MSAKTSKKNRKSRKSRKGKKNRKSRKGKKKVLKVGIISVPLTPGKKFFSVCGDSYIATAHIGWLKRQGIKIVPIPYTTKDFKYYMDRINGLYLY